MNIFQKLYKRYEVIVILIMDGILEFKRNIAVCVLISIIISYCSGLAPYFLSVIKKWNLKYQLFYALSSMYLISISSTLHDIFFIPVVSYVQKTSRILLIKNLCRTSHESSLMTPKIRRVPYIISNIMKYSYQIFIHIINLLIQIYRVYIYSFPNLYIVIVGFLIFFLLSFHFIFLWMNYRIKSYEQSDALGSKTQKVLNNTNCVNSSLVTQELGVYLNNDEYYFNQQFLIFSKYFILLKLIPYLTFSLYSYFSWNYIISSHHDVFEKSTLFFFVSFSTFSAIQIISNLRFLLGSLIGLPKQIYYLSNIKTFETNHHNIILQNVSFEYKEEAILKSIFWTFENGTWTLIQGHNGSGKTLLCKLISGRLLPTKGNIKIFNTNLSQITQPHWQSQITLKTQTESFISERYHLKKSNLWKKYFSKYDYLLSKIELSKGENNFLSIASLLLYDKPFLLILDETLDSLDDTKRKDIMDMLKLEFSFVIIVSHNIDTSYFDAILNLQQ